MIRSSKKLLKLAPKPIQSIDIPKNIELKPLNPVFQYKKQMTELRKRYAHEHAENVKKQQLEQQKLELEKKEVMENIQKDIIAFKKDRENTPETKLDVSVLREFKKTKSQEKVKGVSVKAQVLAMKKKRWERHLQTQDKLSKNRIDNLTRLFYAAKDFVTYKNLEKKLDYGANYRSNDLISNGDNRIQVIARSRALQIEQALKGELGPGEPTLEKIEAGKFERERVAEKEEI